MRKKHAEKLLEKSKALLDRIEIAVGSVRFTHSDGVTVEELVQGLEKAVKDASSSGQHTFHGDSCDIGPDEAAILREEVIRARDTALEETRFGEAVKLSHAISFMQSAGEYIWGVNLEQMRKDLKREKPST